MRIRILVGALVATMALTSCATTRPSPEFCGVVGSVVGAAGGAVAGAAIHDGGGDAGAGIAGGAVGSVLGAIGSYYLCKALEEEPAPKPAPTPEPTPKPTPVPTPTPMPEPDPCQERVSFGGVNFDFDKATVRDDAKPTLDRWAARLMECSNVSVAVSGHTDSVGADSYNQQLSERRANAVRDVLIADGVAGDRLTATGYGASMPVASNADAAGRAQNRRIELTPSE